MNSKILLMILICMCMLACQNEISSPPEKIEAQLSENISLYHLLVFKKEQKIELWATDSESNIALVQSFSTINCKKTPTGIFHVTSFESLNLGLETPNEFYDQVIGKEQFENIFILQKNSDKVNRQSIIVENKTFNQINNYLNPSIKTQVFVFPNDIRNGGYFEPCYGCPHRMAELYSSLELHLMQFEIKTG